MAACTSRPSHEALGEGGASSDAGSVAPPEVSSSSADAGSTRPPAPRHRTSNECGPTFTNPSPVSGCVVDNDSIVGCKCQSDADCTAGSNGRCFLAQAMSGGRMAAGCAYDECTSDADCPNAGLCACGAGQATNNVCVKGNTCRVDNDCAVGERCTPDQKMREGCCSWPLPEYHCTSPADQCTPWTPDSAACIFCDGSFAVPQPGCW